MHLRCRTLLWTRVIRVGHFWWEYFGIVWWGTFCGTFLMEYFFEIFIVGNFYGQFSVGKGNPIVRPVPGRSDNYWTHLVIIFSFIGRSYFWELWASPGNLHQKLIIWCDRWLNMNSWTVMVSWDQLFRRLTRWAPMESQFLKERRSRTLSRNQKLFKW